MNNWLSRQLPFGGQSTRRRIFVALLLGSVCAGTAAAPVTLNLKDADINALVESMSVLTRKNFIVDPRVKGRVCLLYTSRCV